MAPALHCPVCGDALPAEAAPNCDACGAQLTEALLDLARREIPAAAGAPSKPPLPPQTLDESDESDKLIDAFRAQFSQHQIPLPAAWIGRLRSLSAAAEASRRQAMVFFVDLRGYTTLCQNLSEGRLDALLKWFYGMVSRHVDRRGGFVIQLLGDAVFAAFGAPWAFERDAESGLRALLDIRRDVRERGEFDGFPLAIRAGADCGEVNVRLNAVQNQKRPDLFGSTVNLAARLQAAAETWELLLSDTLAEQVKGVFKLEARPPFTPKNYNRQVQPFALIAHLEQAAERRRQDLKFVGRECELARIAALAAQSSEGAFGSLHLTGEAGVGKTRLVEEAIGRLNQDRFKTIAADCDPYDRYMLFRATATLVKSLIAGQIGGQLAGQISEMDLAAAIAAAAPSIDPSVVPSLGYLLGAEPHASRLASLPGKALRLQIVSSLASFFEAAASLRPLILFLDNAQWIDRLSWDAIELLRSRKPPRILLIAASRPMDEADRRVAASPDAFDPIAAIRRGAWEAIELGPLGEPEAEALLAQLLDLQRLHPLLRQRLLAETEKIPLYLIEMAASVAKDQSLPDAGAPATDRVRLSRSGIPPSVIEILQARIDALQARRRAVMQCGAVLGRRFSQSLIRVFDATYPELMAELDALKGMNILRETPLFEEIQYSFSPTLLQEVAYRMLTSEQQSLLHRRVAELIEQRFADRLPSLAFELAMHWMRAGNAARSRRYLARAGRQALARGAPHETHELIQQAIQSFNTPESEDAANNAYQLQQRALLEGLAGQAARMLGDYPRSQEHFHRLSQIAETLGNERWRHEGLCGMAAAALERGEATDAWGFLNQIPERAQGKIVCPAAWNVRGLLFLRTGRFEKALHVLQELAVLIDAENPLLADAWNNMGLVRWQLGRLADAAASFEQALAIWRKIGNPFSEIAAQSNLSIIAEKQGRLEEAKRRCEQALARAEELGYLHGISAILANLSNLELLRREWPAAELHASRSLYAARLIGHANSEAIALENLGLAQGGAGFYEEAIRSLRLAEQLGDQSGDPLRRDSARLAQAWVAFAKGRQSVASHLMERIGTDLSPDLQAWRETLQLACRASDGLNGFDDFEPEKIESWQRGVSLEDGLRRLDAAILLCERGVFQHQVELLRKLREDRLAGIA